MQKSRDSTDETLAELLETKFLTCGSCSEHYSQPRILPCLHSFCEKCVLELASKHTKDACNTKGGDNSSKLLECPTCKSSIGLPKTGVKEFPSNPFLGNLSELHSYKHGEKRTCDYCSFDGKSREATSLCLECKDDICDSCSEAHRRTKVTRGHLVVPFAQIHKGLYDHDIRTSQKQICSVHEDEKISDFCDRCESLICSSCKLSDHEGHHTSDIELSLTKYKLQMELLLSGLQNQIPNMHSYVKFLHDYLNKMEETRLKLLSDMENQANTLHIMIDDYKNKMGERINEMCVSEKELLDKKTDNISTAAKSLEANADYLVRLLHHGNAEEVLSLHKQITYRLTQLVHMQMDGIEKKLKIGFSPNIPLKKDIETIFGSLALGHVPLSQKELQQLPGTNCLSMTSLLPNVLNDLQTFVKFEAKSETDTKDVWPTGLTITPSNDIVVVDRDNKKVKIYTETGEKKQEFTGKNEHKLGTPFDVTMLLNGNIAVTDYEAENVKIFTQTGEHVFSITGDFKYPRGITTGKEGEIIVVDCNKLQITLHNPSDGKLIKTIKGADKSGKKILVDPYYVCVNSAGDIFVTDTAAPNIKVFNTAGEYLAQYGTYGTKPDQTLQPFGVCSDSYGYLFVADNHNDRVHLLKPDGNFLKFLLTKEDGVWHPMCVAVTTHGHLAVTEALGQIKVFKYI